MELHLSELSHDRKKTHIYLQWVLVLATSYFLLFKKGQLVQDPRAFLLVLVLFASVLVLTRLPPTVFDHKLFPQVLVVSDTVLILVAIGLNRESPWDLFLVFFFGLFIASIGENLVKIVVGCLIVSVISVIINPLSGARFYQPDPDLLFRIPFIFGVSILYGYLAEHARKEKERAERADQTDRLKRQLVSALAHDIKNPLGVIMGFADMVASQLEDRPDERESVDALQRIQDNARRIVKLVTGFLDASRAETGKIELAARPLQLNLMLKEVGQQQMGELRRKKISLDLDLEENLPQIMGDAGQIDRVLWNLVGNAIKYTPVGGKVILRSRAENGQVCVSVKDTGMGIPRDEVPLLFSEFRRLRGSAKIEGTGLGLFIVKTVVEAHGGTVDVESQEGQGSTFTARFPVRP